MRSVTVVLILLGFSGFAQNSTGDFVELTDIKPLQQLLQKKAATTTTLHANFTQTKHLSFLKDPAVSKGELFLDNKGNLLWEYHEPAPSKTIVHDGKSVAVRIDEKGQQVVSKNKGFGNMADIIAAIQQGDIEKVKHFTIKSYRKGDVYKLIFKPTPALIKKYVNNIEVFLSKKTAVVSTVIINEPSKDYTKIVFSNVELNIPLESSTFKLPSK